MKLYTDVTFSQTIWSSTLVKDARSMNTQIEELNRQIRNFEKRRGFKSENATKLKERCENHPTEPEKSEQPSAAQPEKKAEEAEKVQEEEKGMIEVKMVADEVELLVNEVRVSYLVLWLLSLWHGFGFASFQAPLTLFLIFCLHVSNFFAQDFASATMGIEKVIDSEDPLDALQFVKALKKKGLIYLDQLMKDLLKLDAVSTSGSARQARKKQVKNQKWITRAQKKNKNIPENRNLNLVLGSPNPGTDGQHWGDSRKVGSIGNWASS